MKKQLQLFILAFAFSATSFAQKDTCSVGIFIRSIYDFRLDEKTFTADFWMWINYKNDSLHFENGIEIPNSKTVEFSHFAVEKKSTWNWATQKCIAQLMHPWDISKFPFDKQTLQI